MHSFLSVAAAAAKSCPTLQSHRRQPTRPPCPWDSPGKNTGVGCHSLLQCMKVKSESEVAQSCPTLNDPMDCSLPGSSNNVIFQARLLEWGAIAFSSICLIDTYSMDEFNSDDHYIYYRGQDSLRRNGVAFIVNQRVRNAVLGYNLKNNRMISVCFQGKPFNITVIQVSCGSLLPSPGSWCAQVSVCASKSLFPWSCVSSGSSVVGLMATSFKKGYATPRSAVLAAVHC